MAGLTAPARTAELERRLAAVRARIATACERAGRDPGTVTLVAVTKTWPAADVVALHALGVTDVGENRADEAVDKAAALRDLGLTWHFVGQLQTNKVRALAPYADVVHALDRPRVVTALGRAAAAAGRVVRGLVQVSLDPDGAAAGRGGADAADVRPLADLVAATEGLELAGVMAVAPLGVDPAPAFARMAAVAESVRAAHPAATWVSAGMSGDLEAAVAAGATHVRVGSAILGTRPPRG